MGVSKVQIRLVPWDPESEEHVERLYQQRVACTWKKEEVQSWRNLQRSGEMSIQWIVRVPPLMASQQLTQPHSRSSLTPTKKKTI
jgi:hypothetical protein